MLPGDEPLAPFLRNSHGTLTCGDPAPHRGVRRHQLFSRTATIFA